DRKLLEPTPRNVGQQLVAIAKMPVGRGRTDAGPACGFGKGETSRALLGDQLQRRADQRFLQIAVVIAARAILPGPGHVKGPYMAPAPAATGWSWRAGRATRHLRRAPSDNA